MKKAMIITGISALIVTAIIAMYVLIYFIPTNTLSRSQDIVVKIIPVNKVAKEVNCIIELR